MLIWYARQLGIAIPWFVILFACVLRVRRKEGRWPEWAKLGGAVVMVGVLLLNAVLFDPFVGLCRRGGVDDTLHLVRAWGPVFSIGPVVGMLGFAIGEAAGAFRRGSVES